MMKGVCKNLAALLALGLWPSLYHGAPAAGADGSAASPAVMPSRNALDIFYGSVRQSRIQRASANGAAPSNRVYSARGQFGEAVPRSGTPRKRPEGQEPSRFPGQAAQYQDDSQSQPSAEGFPNVNGEIFTDGDAFNGGDVFYEGDYPAGDSSGWGAFYARGEYLSWWLSGDSVPPLVTTSPASTPRAEAGVLGEPDTTILFGNETLNDGGRSGARVVLGMSLGPYTWLEGEWFGLGSQQSSFNQSSDGSTILARPFFNLFTGAEDANLIAFPDVFEGTIDARVNSEFQGAGLHLTRNLSYYCEDNGCYSHRIDFLYGFRYLGLYENAEVDGSTTSIDPASPVPVGTVFTASDSFRTSNNFYGGNLGILMETRRGAWFLTAIGRLGIGGTTEEITISGSSTATEPGQQTVTSEGGLLALPTNIGSYSHNAFGLVPQLELKVAYLLTPRLRWTVGYDLIYWNRVVRPGPQIDLFVNPSQSADQPLEGTPGPLFSFEQSDLWIQGVSTGIEWQF